MPLSIANPEPPENPAIRSRLHHLVALAAIFFTASLAAMTASFIGILPNWVGWTANVVAALGAWLAIGRGQALRRRLKTPRQQLNWTAKLPRDGEE
jgi:hypothetical protein